MQDFNAIIDTFIYPNDTSLRRCVIGLYATTEANAIKEVEFHPEGECEDGKCSSFSTFICSIVRFPSETDIENSLSTSMAAASSIDILEKLLLFPVSTTTKSANFSEPRA